MLTLVVLWFFVVSMFQTDEEWLEENDKWQWLGPNDITTTKNHPCYDVKLMLIRKGEILKYS